MNETTKTIYTERFNVFLTRRSVPNTLAPIDTWVAFLRGDIASRMIASAVVRPMPGELCLFVEHVQVDASHRNQGFATELLCGLLGHYTRQIGVISLSAKAPPLGAHGEAVRRLFRRVSERTGTKPATPTHTKAATEAVLDYIVREYAHYMSGRRFDTQDATGVPRIVVCVERMEHDLARTMRIQEQDVQRAISMLVECGHVLSSPTAGTRHFAVMLTDGPLKMIAALNRLGSIALSRAVLNVLIMHGVSPGPILRRAAAGILREIGDADRVEYPADWSHTMSVYHFADVSGIEEEVACAVASYMRDHHLLVEFNLISLELTIDQASVTRLREAAAGADA